MEYNIFELGRLILFNNIYCMRKFEKWDDSLITVFISCADNELPILTGVNGATTDDK